jgi:hypothetical protein
MNRNKKSLCSPFHVHIIHGHEKAHFNFDIWDKQWNHTGRKEEKQETRAFFKAIVLTFHIMKPNMYLLAIYLWGDFLSFFFTIKRE